MKAFHLLKGEESESASHIFLKQKGLKLIEKNFLCRMGEIDLIMLDKQTLVFVEVRFRKNNHFGGAIESITPQKQMKLRRTAELYLQQNPQYEDARFDVIAITPNKKNQPHFDWITNAF